MRINVTHKDHHYLVDKKVFIYWKVIASSLRNFCIKTTKNLLSYNYTLIRNSNKNKTMKMMPILHQVLFMYKLWTVFIQNSILFWHILNLIWYKKFTITFHQMVQFEFQVSTAAKKYVCQSLITFRIKTKGFQELVNYSAISLQQYTYYFCTECLSFIFTSNYCSISISIFGVWHLTLEAH